MEIEVLYNVHHEMPLGLLIATYFYLTGMSAGSFVMSVYATVLGNAEYKPMGKIGAVLAPILLMIAPINLILDLEQPLRFWHLFFYLNLASPITYGTFLLTAYPIEGLIYAYFLFKGNKKAAKICGLIGIPLALSVHGYTGFILGLAKARVLWNSPIVVVLFLVSAMVSGIALLIVIAAIRNTFFMKKNSLEEKATDKKLIFNLGKAMAAFIAIDLFLVFSDVLVMTRHTEDAWAVVNLVRFGEFAPLFVGVEIIMGGIIPLMIIALPGISRSYRALLLASVLVLVGVYAMRYVLVVGGQYVPLS